MLRRVMIEMGLRHVLRSKVWLGMSLPVGVGRIVLHVIVARIVVISRWVVVLRVYILWITILFVSMTTIHEIVAIAHIRLVISLVMIIHELIIWLDSTHPIFLNLPTSLIVHIRNPHILPIILLLLFGKHLTISIKIGILIIFSFDVRLRVSIGENLKMYFLQFLYKFIMALVALIKIIDSVAEDALVASLWSSCTTDCMGVSCVWAVVALTHALTNIRVFIIYLLIFLVYTDNFLSFGNCTLYLV